MDGDNGRKKKFDRNIELEYNHDRLIGMKIIQVYQLLVPDKIWVKDIDPERDNRKHGTSSDICESVFGPSKRRAHY
jgi:hypothetical protein